MSLIFSKIIQTSDLENDFRGFIRVATISALAMSTQVSKLGTHLRISHILDLHNEEYGRSGDVPYSHSKPGNFLQIHIQPFWCNCCSTTVFDGKMDQRMNIMLFQSSWMVIPYSLLFVFTLIDIVIFQMFIPETKGLPLPDRLPEKESEKKKQLLEKEDSSV